ncbi:outer membrane protein assembly factor BamA [Buchnera aphidicola (Hyadaphis tataricae)]|uniref:Outer membrane protein assembly factor BamA n=1 Tax=Buchnera aphidicola (Hyadaphis tataricae) TaxID=1241859 RepID=A0A4D6XVT8_9GAMM|nr:outer membrane protein assembly factor BamA [Buchnera aphidicola]QCI21546.1 outer membrane protein assembly factor BamA [Buchnera aphidicola (Hyadaphis tataricae)]
MLIKKFFMCFLMIFSTFVYAKNIWFVKDIEFTGLKNYSKNELLNNIQFHVGSTVSNDDIKSSIKSLFKTGRFEDIQVFLSKDKIVFHVYERPIIADVLFSGNTIINNNALKKYLTKLHIEKNHVFNPSIAEMFIKTIHHAYEDLGRYKSHVKILKSFSTYNRVNLKILIDEGLPIKINNIEVLGVKSFPKTKIISLFQLKQDHSWWNVFDNFFYSPKFFDHSLNKLHNFYLSQGYFYFQINKSKIDYVNNVNNQHGVNIKINVFEGEQYRISKFFVNGNLLSYKNLIENMIKIDKNELYNKDKLDDIIIRIKQRLSEYGYIDAEVSIDPEVNHKSKKIIIHFNIDIKKRFFVRKIQFIGNRSTQDQVLRRLIKQIEGRYVNSKLIDSGKKLLEKTKFFSDVQIIKNHVFNTSNQVDIIYQVKEQPTGSINFGLGYGMDSGVSFNTSFSKDNLLGSGNSFKSTIIKNNNQQYADVSMIFPYFIFNTTDLNTRFFYNDFKYNLNGMTNVTKNTYGFESNFGLPLNDYNKINFGFGYSHNGIFNENNTAKKSLSNNNEWNTKFLQTNSVNDFTINYSWIYDSLQYRYFPIDGNQTYVSGKNTIPGSDNNFYKIILDSEVYLPLNKAKELIFLSHLHMGIGNSFNGDKLPFYENFSVTGVNNIRGFQPHTIGPKTVYNLDDAHNCTGYEHDNLCESIDSIGGNSTVVANLELITPIPFLDHVYSKFLRSSIFFDIGNIWDTQQNNKNNLNSLMWLKNNILNDVYASIGISLQWFSPIGPLAFSYAIPVQKNNYHQLEAFQFNIGKNW